MFKEKTRPDYSDSPIVSLVEGVPLTARLVDIHEITTRNGKSDLADLVLLEDCDQLVEKVDGNTVNLAVQKGGHVSIFVSAGLPLDDGDIGLPVRITFLGLQTNPKSGRQFNAYKVEVDRNADGGPAD